MRAATTTFSRYVKQSNTTAFMIFSMQRLRNRFRYLVEVTDWDEELIAQEKWINKICLVTVILSVLYFAPVIVSTFLK
jgi:hypothetical protein